MKVEKNKVVTLEFDVYDEKTNELLETTSTDIPFSYIHRADKFLPKIEDAIDGKEIGYQTSVLITPEEGYGEYDENLLVELDKSQFDEYEDIYVGMDFVADMDDGEELDFIITAIDDQKVKADGNHPFSGKTVKFNVVIVDVRDATDQELKEGEPFFDDFEEGDEEYDDDGCCDAECCCHGHDRED
ncbi:MAG: peptidylprolyl isomerase [Fusobacteriaceae bacterium]|jgi:FKBP-type peptidyl-prolyl cis-trans isomerase SlyD|nr:peptidylprolyl isomerase [Fusobacteriaceae bacterium]